eukprot:XP_011663073.1 PREDICTED: alpha-2,8-sialyltransferase 8B-like [Strongylocentrotus purpuratus]
MSNQDVVYLPKPLTKIFGYGDKFNESAVQEIQRRVSAYISPWQAVQIIHPDVPREKIIYSSNQARLTALHQSETISGHNQCALIGNAGILLESGCGDVIDKFEFVIRMNLAPSGGEFKRDVGSKVNLVTLNAEQIGRLISCTNSSYPPEWKCKSEDEDCLQKRERKYPPLRAPTNCDSLLRRMKRFNGTTLWYFKSIGRIFDATKRMLGILKPKYNIDINFAYSTTSLMSPSHKAWNVGFPSSGMAILTAATQFCQQITMFGFYPFSQDSRNRTLRHHYYEEGTMNYTSNQHHMPNEYRIFLELNRTGAINLVNECR